MQRGNREREERETARRKEKQKQMQKEREREHMYVPRSYFVHCLAKLLYCMLGSLVAYTERETKRESEKKMNTAPPIK